MIKRVLITALIVGMMIPISLSAQSMGFTSLQNDFSQGIFKNEVDNAIDVDESGTGSGFSQLSHSYILGGLMNYNEQDANSNSTDPVLLGYYHNGDLKWSFMASLNMTGVGAETVDQITDSANTVNVTTGTDTVTHYWYDTVTTTKDVSNRIISDMDNRFQFLINFGNINTGLYLRLDKNNDATGNLNKTTEVQDFYNPNGAGVPAQILNFTRTTVVADDDGSDFTFQFVIPFFMKMGNMSHLATFGFSRINYYDDNIIEESLKMGDSPDTSLATQAFNGIQEKDNYTKSYAQNDIDMSYNLIIPGFIGSHKNNNFSAGMKLGIDINTGTNLREVITQDYLYTLAGNTFAKQDRDEDTYEYDISGSTDWSFELNAAHSFYYDQGDAIKFGIRPYIAFQFAGYTNGVNVDTYTTTIKNDNDNNGDVTSTDDTSTVTKSTYSGLVMTNSFGTTGKVATFSFTTNIELPMAIQYQPKSWLFGITLASKPYITITKTLETTTANETSVSAENSTVGTGVTSTGNYSGQETRETKTSATTWNFGATHTIGMNMTLPEDIKVYFLVNANMLNFDGFTIQASIPFDAFSGGSSSSSEPVTKKRKTRRR